MNPRTIFFSLRGWVCKLSAQLKKRRYPFWFLSCILFSGLFSAGCSNTPPAPDWQVNAFGAAERAMQAQLLGQTRVEKLEWDRARSEVARTGQPARLATLELLRCAGLMASLQAAGCPAFAQVEQDAAPADRAYAQYLRGNKLSPESIALLPAAQQAIAKSTAQLEPLQTASASSTATAQLQAINDPLSQLVAASVLWRRGLATPAIVEQAVQTASHQGWRVPLIAWLNVQAEQAQQRGDTQLTQAIARRLQLIEQDGRVQP